MKFSTLIVWFFILSPYYLFSQTDSKSLVDMEVVNKLSKGIYLSFDEFKNNNPSITGEFDVTNENPNYILYPEENNKYFISYYDHLGGKVDTNLEGIWGFNDGFGIYIIHNNKPYKIVFFGAISILQYENHYKRNIAAQTASLVLFGRTVTEGHKIKLLYFSPLHGGIFKYNEEDFKQLLSKDQNLLQNYSNDASIKLNIKRSVYLEKFNNKYPISLSNEGVVVEY